MAVDLVNGPGSYRQTRFASHFRVGNCPSALGTASRKSRSRVEVQTLLWRQDRRCVVCLRHKRRSNREPQTNEERLGSRHVHRESAAIFGCRNTERSGEVTALRENKELRFVKHRWRDEEAN